MLETVRTERAAGLRAHDAEDVAGKAERAVAFDLAAAFVIRRPRALAAADAASVIGQDQESTDGRPRPQQHMDQDHGQVLTPAEKSTDLGFGDKRRGKARAGSEDAGEELGRPPLAIAPGLCTTVAWLATRASRSNSVGSPRGHLVHLHGHRDMARRCGANADSGTVTVCRCH